MGGGETAHRNRSSDYHFFWFLMERGMMMRERERERVLLLLGKSLLKTRSIIYINGKMV